MNLFKKFFYRKHEFVGTVQQVGLGAGERGVYLVKNYKGEVLRAYVKAKTDYGMAETAIDPILAQQGKIIRI